ncbi:MAG: hypothetical protein AAFN80_01975 [Pseudomonadota bacterium]
MEEEKLAAFEKGYQAGWEDSNAARNETSATQSSDLIAALQEMSRSLDESQSDVLFQVQPLLDQIVGKLLPKIAQKTLVPTIKEVVHELLKTHSHQPVQIHCAPAQVNELQTALNSYADLSISVVEDPRFETGQVNLSFGTLAEQELDFKSVIDGIAEMIDTFFEANAHDVKTKDVA